MKKLASLLMVFGLALPVSVLTVGCNDAGVEEDGVEVEDGAGVDEGLGVDEGVEENGVVEDNAVEPGVETEPVEPDAGEPGAELIPETETNEGGPEVPATPPAEPE